MIVLARPQVWRRLPTWTAPLSLIGGLETLRTSRLPSDWAQSQLLSVLPTTSIDTAVVF